MKESHERQAESRKRRVFMRAVPPLLACAVLISGCSGPSDDANADAAVNNAADMGGAGTNNSTNNSTNTADMSPDAPAEDMSVLKSTVEMTTNFIDPFASQVVAGVKVCVLDAVPENCAVTDVDGGAQLQVPAGIEFALVADLATYYSQLYTVPATDEDFVLSDLAITQQAPVFGLLSTIGVTQDAEKGGVAIAVHGEGVMPALEPDVGEEFWYLVGADISRSETGTPALLSYTGVANLPPGEYHIRFEHDMSNCETWGWAGDTPNEQRFIVRAGYLTGLFTASCL